MSNIERFKKDIERLEIEGSKLVFRMLYDLFPDQMIKNNKKEQLEKLPLFDTTYQRWYSESLAMLAVILPDRLNDFKAYYQLPRAPKELNFSTYTISDYIKGTNVTIGYEKRPVVGPSAAQTPHATAVSKRSPDGA